MPTEIRPRRFSSRSEAEAWAREQGIDCWASRQIDGWILADSRPDGVYGIVDSERMVRLDDW